ncbi:MAG: hypothetical protein HYY16_12115 [Planctomycetes bacterium]|nr:hypothetical protein [Planctomycetota bacterium]
MQVSGDLTFTAPAEWTAERPAMSMRKAQYAVPDKEKAQGNATFIYFGSMGGTVEQNIERWKGQFSKIDGEAKTETFKAGDLKMTVLDVAGEYASDMGGGSQGDARMLGAVVETPGGLHFFKFFGPRGTVEDWRDAFVELIKGVRTGGP